jgi:hypothetical protein
MPTFREIEGIEIPQSLRFFGMTAARSLPFSPFPFPLSLFPFPGFYRAPDVYGKCRFSRLIGAS